jgi:hypothetical protein
MCSCLPNANCLLEQRVYCLLNQPIKHNEFQNSTSEAGRKMGGITRPGVDFLMRNSFICSIWCSYSGGYQEFCVLGYNAV